MTMTKTMTKNKIQNRSLNSTSINYIVKLARNGFLGSKIAKILLL
jgi:hypothetical protein